MGRIALVAALSLVTFVATVGAQPEGGIDMDPDSAGSGSAAQPDAQPQPDEAQPAQPVKDPKVARKWLSAAQTLVQKGDYFTRAKKPDDAKAQYENALTAYDKAIEAGDDIGVNYSVALVLEKLGRNADAYKKLKIVLAPGAVVKPDILKKSQAKLDELSTKIGLLTLVVKPDGTAITIAGQEIGDAPLPEPIVLDPGTYTLSMTAVGYQPKDSEVKVEAGSESERKIELEPVKMVVKQEEPEPVEPVRAAKPPSKLPLYVGAGATGAFVLTATITGIMAVSNHSKFTGATTDPVDRLDARDNGRTLAHVTDVMLVGAIGSAAFTTYWYFKKYRPAARTYESHPTTMAKVQVVPWVQPGTGGVVLGGAF